MAGKIDSNPLLSQLGIQEKQQKENDKRTTLGQEEFFRLMIAQMRNQSPLNPMDNTKFLGELAQFSNLASQQETQKTIERLADSLISSQALQASSLVGRFVLVPGDTAYLPEGQDRFLGGAVELDQATDDLVVDIYSPSGQWVKRLSLGGQSAGTVRFTWDGTGTDGNPLPAGDYRIVANARVDGEMQAQNTLVVGPVESVTLGRNGQRSQVNVAGLGPVDINDVREIL